MNIRKDGGNSSCKSTYSEEDLLMILLKRLKLSMGAYGSLYISWYGRLSRARFSHFYVMGQASSGHLNS